MIIGFTQACVHVTKTGAVCRGGPGWGGHGYDHGYGGYGGGWGHHGWYGK